MKKKLNEKKSPLINPKEEELEDISSPVLNEVPLENNLHPPPLFQKDFLVILIYLKLYSTYT